MSHPRRSECGEPYKCRRRVPRQKFSINDCSSGGFKSGSAVAGCAQVSGQLKSLPLSRARAESFRLSSARQIEKQEELTLRVPLPDEHVGIDVAVDEERVGRAADGASDAHQAVLDRRREQRSGLPGTGGVGVPYGENEDQHSPTSEFGELRKTSKE